MSTISSIKKYVIWFFIWLSVIVSVWYAANTGSIWELFKVITTDNNWSTTSNYRLDWTNIQDWTVTVNELAPNSVTNVKMADNSVTTNEIVDWTISNWDLANNSVNSSKVADNTLTASDLAADSVWSSELIETNNYTVWSLVSNWNIWVYNWASPKVWLSTNGDWVFLWNLKVSGNVWIWTTNPSEKLHVVWNARITWIANCSWKLYTDSNWKILCWTISETDPQVGSNTTNYVPKWNGSALVKWAIYDNGNIWIWTTSPTNKLSIVWWGLDIDSNWDNNRGSVYELNWWLVLSSEVTSRRVYDMFIQPSWNVWIWTISPTEKLQVSWSIKATWHIHADNMYAYDGGSIGWFVSASTQNDNSISLNASYNMSWHGNFITISDSPEFTVNLNWQKKLKLSSNWNLNLPYANPSSSNDVVTMAYLNTAIKRYLANCNVCFEYWDYTDASEYHETCTKLDGSDNMQDRVVHTGDDSMDDYNIYVKCN